MHAIGLDTPLGHNGRQAIVAAVDGITGLRDGRQFPDVSGHVAQKPTELLQGLGLGVHRVVDRTSLINCDFCATEILFVDRLAQGSLHNWRPGGKYLTGRAYHNRKMRQDRSAGRPTSRSAQYSGHNRDTAQQLD